MTEMNLHGLGPFIKTEEHMDMQACLTRMLDSDLLLAISPEDIDYNVPQKIYTYMKIGVPIFAVMPEHGEAASVIKASGTGYVVGSGDIDRIAKKLHGLYQAWKTDALVPKPDNVHIAEFDKRKLTGELANLFYRMCGNQSTTVKELNHNGETLFEEGKLKEALAAFQQALAVDPASADTLNNLGVVLFRLNRYEGALTYLRKAVEINPKDKNALLNLYRLYRSLESQNHANDILEKIREHHGGIESADREETLPVQFP